MSNNQSGIRMEYLSGVLAHYKSGHQEAYRVSERFVQAAKFLGEEEFIGWQIVMDKENTYDNYLFACPETKITREDFNWIFSNYAVIVPEKSIVSDNAFQEYPKIYELIPSPDVRGANKKRADKTSLKDKAYNGNQAGEPYFNEMCKEMSLIGASICVIAGTGCAAQGGMGIVRFGFREEMSLRMRSLISLVFPDTVVQEADEVSGTCGLPEYQLHKSVIKLLGIFRQKTEEPTTDSPFDLPESDWFVEDENESDDEDDFDWYGTGRDDDNDNTGEELNSENSTEDTIESLDLSVRSFNVLKRAGINTIEQLRRMSDEDFYKIKNLGRKSLDEIKHRLAEIPDISKKVALEASSYTEMLDKLIGIREAKEQVKRIAAFARMQEDMHRHGKTPIPVAMNMEFIGNPGTAKTTVARIMAGIFNETGLLSGKEIVEVGRADLVAEYTGQTAAKVKTVFENAKGKVLFIDEAYSLVEHWSGSFGDEAINTIVQEMENHRADTVVIFAGYPDKMEEFFSRNPGLRSRVPFTVKFSDYSAEELVNICELEAEKRGFTIDRKAVEKLSFICNGAAGNPAVGNGRFCRNLIENAILGYASRLYGDEAENVDADYTLTEEDLVAANTVPQKASLPIGFSA